MLLGWTTAARTTIGSNPERLTNYWALAGVGGKENRSESPKRSRAVKWYNSAPPSHFSQRDAADKSTAPFRSTDASVVTSSPTHPPMLR